MNDALAAAYGGAGWSPRNARLVDEIGSVWSNFAVASESAHQAFVAQVFHHLVKQNSAAFGADTVDQLRQQFAQDDFNIQNLMVRIAVLSATHQHDPTDSPAYRTSHTP